MEDNADESEEEDSADEEFLLIQQAVVEKDKGNQFFKVIVVCVWVFFNRTLLLRHWDVMGYC